MCRRTPYNIEENGCTIQFTGWRRTYENLCFTVAQAWVYSPKHGKLVAFMEVGCQVPAPNYKDRTSYEGPSHTEEQKWLEERVVERMRQAARKVVQ